MHVLVLGGTGGIGPLLVRELLATSHTVVVYARSPQKVPSDISSNPGVTVVQGELTDAAALASALVGVHAVVSALGPSARHPPGTPLAKGYAVVIAQMKEVGVPRLIALGTGSITDEHDKSDKVFWLLVGGVSLLAHNAYKDIVAVGETIRASGDALAWTIARVPLLTNGQTREYQTGYLGDGKRTTTLPRLAFSTFIVDELERNDFVRKAPMLSVP
ncbi:NAD-binding protein [Phellopilus nigrolimitatus]|nr:NAD-binding protein [Phellopilus nigrolimitatus]